MWRYHQLGAAVTALFTGTDTAIATTTAQTAVENNSLKVLARILQPLVQRASQTATVKALKRVGVKELPLVSQVKLEQQPKESKLCASENIQKN